MYVYIYIYLYCEEVLSVYGTIDILVAIWLNMKFLLY